MSRSDIARLRDARDYAKHAMDNAGGLSADTLAAALQPQHAALFDLIVVGEALNKVSPDVKALGPSIPWKAVIELRNVIVHGYWQIDLEIIADVVEHELAPLTSELETLIAVVERAEP